jgi:RNA recognition motif-containing protein
VQKSKECPQCVLSAECKQGDDVLHHQRSIHLSFPGPWRARPTVGPASHVISNFSSESRQRDHRQAISESHPQPAMSNLSDTSRLKATVFVGGLDQAVTQQTLFHAFLPFGDIVEVNLPKPENQSQGDQHRGFGYVEFETATGASCTAPLSR